MHGNGQIEALQLTASSACLDYSDLSTARAVPYIDAQLVVDSNTSYKFPALAGAATYQLARRLVDTSGVTGEQTFSIGGHEYQAPLSFNDVSGTAVFPAVATVNGADSEVDWSNITWDAKPATIDNTTVATLNITGDTTLDIAAAATVKKLVLNISDGVTLTLANAGNLTTVDGIVIRGTGALKIGGEVTFAALTVEDNSTLVYNSASTVLTVTGALTVADGKTLALAPATIEGITSTIVTAGSISGTIGLTAPTEDGYTYTLKSTATTRTLRRMPTVGLSYDGTIGATLGGTWLTSWGGETFGDNVRIGPSTAMSIVQEVAASQHPYADMTARTGKMSFALYADISQVADTGKQVLVGIGASGTLNNKFLILYREGSNVKLGVWDVGSQGNTAETQTRLVGTAATVVVPAKGYHLYTATFDNTNGNLELYLDDAAAQAGNAGGAVTLPKGLQIGSLYKGFDNGDYAKTSGEHGLSKGIGMAFAAIRGYDVVLGSGHVAELAADYPATTGTRTDDVQLNAAGKTLTVYSSDVDSSTTFGPEEGNVVITADNTITVNRLHTYPGDQGVGGDNTVTVNGKVIVSQTDASSALTGDGAQNKGVVLGYWLSAESGTRTTEVAVPTDGELDAANSYILMPWSGNVQSATLNINGGTVKAKGLLSNQSGKGKLKLHQGGTLEVGEILSTGEAINKEFWKGTFRVTDDATETRAVKFSAASVENATILDPNGHTLTLNAAAITGDGYVKAKSSAAGGAKGTVSIGGSATDFTGTIIIDDDGKDLLTFSNIANYYGNILYKVTGESNLPSYLSGYTGTLTISGGTVDARGIDLSNAQVILADGATLKATVGQEGPVAVAAGTTLNLYATDDVYNYEGHVFSGSSSGTVNYYYGETPTAAAAASVNGNNLLPYYQIWEVSGGIGSGAVSAAANWKGGEVPGTQTGRTSDGNAAFHVTGDSEITVTVDKSFDFDELQVFGSGTITFAQSENNKITTSVMAVSSGVNVKLSGSPLEISDGIIYGGVNQTITVQNGASLSLDDVDCTVKLVVENGGTLTTSGNTTLRASNRFEAGSSFTVAEEVNGVTKINAEEQGLGGSITIGAGATLVNTRSSDALNYSAGENAKVEIDISGTLDMGTTRWTLGPYNEFTLHQNALIKGAGDGNGALDTNAGQNIPFTIDGNATISAKLRMRSGGGMTFDVATDKTLTLSGGTRGDSNDNGTLTKTGAGILDVTTATSYTGLTTVSAGQMIQGSLPAGNVSIAEGATFTLKGCNWTDNNDKDKFTGSGTLEIDDTSAKAWIYANPISFSGIIKAKGNSTNYPVFGGNGNEYPVFGNDPEFILDGTMVLNGCFNNSKTTTGLPVRDFSGSGSVNVNNNQVKDAYRTISSKQTKPTTFSGTFTSVAKDGGYCNSALRVYGDPSAASVYGLTLTGVNTTYGPLTIDTKGKVIFSGSGSWLNGATTVKANGVLESQSDTQVVGALTLEDGAKLSIANGHVLKTGAVTWPEEGAVRVDATALTSLTSEGATIIESTSAFTDDDVAKLVSVGSHVFELDAEDAKKINVYPAVAKVGDTYYTDLVTAEAAVNVDNPSITIYSGSPKDASIYHYLGNSTYRLKNQDVYLVGGTWSSSAIFWLADNTPTTVYDGDTVVIDGTHFTGLSLAVDPTGPANATSVKIDKDISLTQSADGTILSGTTFTIADGATLTISGATRAVTLGAVTFDKAADTGAVTLNGSTNAITLGGNLSGTAPATITGTVIATGKTIANMLKNTAGGTIVYDGTLPGTAPTFDSSWTGTVWLKNISNLIGATTINGSSFTGTYIAFNSYGNGNSNVRLTGVSGWLYNGESSVPVELYDEGETKALKLEDGISNSAFGLAKLKGSGTLVMSRKNLSTAKATPAFTLVATNATEFVGNLEVKNMRLMIGNIPVDDAKYECDVDGVGKVGVFIYGNAEATVAAGKTWSVGGLYKWNEGKNSANAGTLSVSGTLTVNGTLTVDANAASDNKGKVEIASGASMTIGSAGLVTAVEGITVDGTLSADGKDRWSGAISIGDTGVLQLTGGGNDNSNIDYSGVTGTGTLKYAGTSWRALPYYNDNGTEKYPATTLTLQDEQSSGLVIRATGVVIGSLSGSKNLRSDLNSSYSDHANSLIIKQGKNTSWSGVFQDQDRLNSVTVDPCNGVVGTLTIAGDQIAANEGYTNEQHKQNNDLVVNGAVKLTGSWVGPITVSGTFGGNGTASSTVTFNAGSAYRYDTNCLTVNGGVTVAAGNMIEVAVADGTTVTAEMKLIDWTGNAAPAGYFRFADEELRDDWTLEKRAAGLFVVERATDVTVNVAEGTTTVADNYTDITITKTGAGTAQLTGTIVDASLVVNAGVLDITGATLVSTVLSGAGDVKITGTKSLTGLTLGNFTGKFDLSCPIALVVNTDVKDAIEASMAEGATYTVTDNGNGTWNVVVSAKLDFATNDSGVTVSLPANNGTASTYDISYGKLNGVAIGDAGIKLDNFTGMNRVTPFTLSLDVTIPETIDYSGYADGYGPVLFSFNAGPNQIFIMRKSNGVMAARWYPSQNADSGTDYAGLSNDKASTANKVLVLGHTYRIDLRYWGVLDIKDGDTYPVTRGLGSPKTGTTVFVDGVEAWHHTGLRWGSMSLTDAKDGYKVNGVNYTTGTAEEREVAADTAFQANMIFPTNIVIGAATDATLSGKRAFGGLTVKNIGFINLAGFQNKVGVSTVNGATAGMTASDEGATYWYDYGVTADGATGGYALGEQTTYGVNKGAVNGVYSRGVVLTRSVESPGSVTVAMKVNIPAGSAGGTICEIPTGTGSVKVEYDGATDKFKLNGTAQSSASADGEHTLIIKYGASTGAYLWVDAEESAAYTIADVSALGRAIGDKIYFGSGSAATASNGFFTGLGVESQDVEFGEDVYSEETVEAALEEECTFEGPLANLPLAERVKFLKAGAINETTGKFEVPVPRITIGGQVLTGYAALSAARTLGVYEDTSHTLGFSGYDQSSGALTCNVDPEFAGKLSVSLMGSNDQKTWERLEVKDISSESSTVSFNFNAHAFGGGKDYMWFKLVEDVTNDMPVVTSEISSTAPFYTQVAKNPTDDGLFKTGETGWNRDVYRIPAMAATPDGQTVMGIFDARWCYQDLGVPLDANSNGAGPYSNPDHYTGIDIGGVFSLDGGENWSYPQVMIDVPNGTDPKTGIKTKALTKLMDLGDPCIVYDPTNEKFIMMGITGGGLTTVHNGAAAVDVVTYECSLASVQAGAPEWTNRASVKLDIETALQTAGDFTIPAYKQDWYYGGYMGILEGPGHAFVTRADCGSIPAGTVVWPMQYVIRVDEDSNPQTTNPVKGGNFAAWKDSSGNWHATNLVPNSGGTKNYVTQEGCITQLDNGYLLYMCKNVTLGTARPFYVSSDGVNWTYHTEITDLASGSMCQGSMLRLGTGSDGHSRYVAVFATGALRSDIKAYFGTDNGSGGVNWDTTNTIDVWAGATGTADDDGTGAHGNLVYGYNSLVMLDSTTLGVLFEAHGHIYFTKIDVSDKLK